MKHRINLLSRDQSGSPVDRMVSFFLNYLRYALVITQLIVLSVLFYRFTVDEQIVELNDSITQKQEIFRLVEPMLVEAKTLETKLNVADASITNQSQQLEMIELVLLSFPNNLYLDKASVQRRGLALSGTTGDETQLRAYYNDLVQKNIFENVELKNIVKNETGFSFEISLINYLPKQQDNAIGKK